MGEGKHVVVTVDLERNIARIVFTLELKIFSSNEFYVTGDSETSAFIVKNNERYYWVVKRKGEIVEQEEISADEAREIVEKTLLRDFMK